MKRLWGYIACISILCSTLNLLAQAPGDYAERIKLRGYEGYEPTSGVQVDARRSTNDFSRFLMKIYGLFPPRNWVSHVDDYLVDMNLSFSSLLSEEEMTRDHIVQDMRNGVISATMRKSFSQSMLKFDILSLNLEILGTNSYLGAGKLKVLLSDPLEISEASLSQEEKNDRLEVIQRVKELILVRLSSDGSVLTDEEVKNYIYAARPNLMAHVAIQDFSSRVSEVINGEPGLLLKMDQKVKSLCTSQSISLPNQCASASESSNYEMRTKYILAYKAVQDFEEVFNIFNVVMGINSNMEINEFNRSVILKAAFRVKEISAKVNDTMSKFLNEINEYLMNKVEDFENDLMFRQIILLQRNNRSLVPNSFIVENDLDRAKKRLKLVENLLHNRNQAIEGRQQQKRACVESEFLNNSIARLTETLEPKSPESLIFETKQNELKAQVEELDNKASMLSGNKDRAGTVLDGEINRINQQLEQLDVQRDSFDQNFTEKLENYKGHIADLESEKEQLKIAMNAISEILEKYSGQNIKDKLAEIESTKELRKQEAEKMVTTYKKLEKIHSSLESSDLMTKVTSLKNSLFGSPGLCNSFKGAEAKNFCQKVKGYLGLIEIRKNIASFPNTPISPLCGDIANDGTARITHQYCTKGKMYYDFKAVLDELNKTPIDYKNIETVACNESGPANSASSLKQTLCQQAKKRIKNSKLRTEINYFLRSSNQSKYNQYCGGSDQDSIRSQFCAEAQTLLDYGELKDAANKIVKQDNGKVIKINIGDLNRFCPRNGANLKGLKGEFCTNARNFLTAKQAANDLESFYDNPSNDKYSEVCGNTSDHPYKVTACNMMKDWNRAINYMSSTEAIKREVFRLYVKFINPAGGANWQSVNCSSWRGGHNPCETQYKHMGVEGNHKITVYHDNVCGRSSVSSQTAAFKQLQAEYCQIATQAVDYWDRGAYNEHRIDKGLSMQSFYKRLNGITNSMVKEINTNIPNSFKLMAENIRANKMHAVHGSKLLSIINNNRKGKDDSKKRIKVIRGQATDIYKAAEEKISQVKSEVDALVGSKLISEINGLNAAATDELANINKDISYLTNRNLQFESDAVERFALEAMQVIKEIEISGIQRQADYDQMVIKLKSLVAKINRIKNASNELKRHYQDMKKHYEKIEVLQNKAAKIAEDMHSHNVKNIDIELENVEIAKTRNTYANDVLQIQNESRKVRTVSDIKGLEIRKSFFDAVCNPEHPKDFGLPPEEIDIMTERLSNGIKVHLESIVRSIRMLGKVIDQETTLDNLAADISTSITTIYERHNGFSRVQTLKELIVDSIESQVKDIVTSTLADVNWTDPRDMTYYFFPTGYKAVLEEKSNNPLSRYFAGIDFLAGGEIEFNQSSTPSTDDDQGETEDTGGSGDDDFDDFNLDETNSGTAAIEEVATANQKMIFYTDVKNCFAKTIATLAQEVDSRVKDAVEEDTAPNNTPAFTDVFSRSYPFHRWYGSRIRALMDNKSILTDTDFSLLNRKIKQAWIARKYYNTMKIHSELVSNLNTTGDNLETKVSSFNVKIGVDAIENIEQKRINGVYPVIHQSGGNRQDRVKHNYHFSAITNSLKNNGLNKFLSTSGSSSDENSGTDIFKLSLGSSKEMGLTSSLSTHSDPFEFDGSLFYDSNFYLASDTNIPDNEKVDSVKRAYSALGQSAVLNNMRISIRLNERASDTHTYFGGLGVKFSYITRINPNQSEIEQNTLYNYGMKYPKTPQADNYLTDFYLPNDENIYFLDGHSAEPKGDVLKWIIANGDQEECSGL